MKKIGIVLSLVFVVISFSTIEAQEKLDVIIENSTINWKGYKPTGSHEGTIGLQSASILMQGNQIAGGSFSVDMTSIKDTDESSRLEKHLKSKDFFEVEVFPIAKFEISEVESNNEEKVSITGNMTIKDITKQITFLGIIAETENTISLNSDIIKINRADFNIKYKSKSFFNNLKEKFINDEFDLQVNIVAKK